ncbi:hypothetical protein MNBD_UNCLBAC01-673 [hydrothermal vent metagenome]|uniref:Uncharacterized protein n=1 Tax=hydrothermal vent metagenome TaxID=652676 RepID=A0A3B1DFN2_9ZZZZ
MNKEKRCIFGIGLGTFLLFFSLGLVVYWPSFHAPFQLDDYTTIVDNPTIKSVSHWPSLWNKDPTRFLTNITFTINYYYGKLDVVGYHAINFFLHLCVSFLVYQFVKLISSIRGLPFWSALIFLTHPIQTSAVTYVVQRSTLLTTFFYLLALNLYITYRMKGLWRYYVFALLAVTAGLFCKPIIITIPLSILLYEICFVLKEKKMFKEIILRVFPFVALVMVVPVLLVLWKHKTFHLFHLLSITRETSVFTRQEYLFTQFNVLATYIRLLFFPVNQKLDYDYPITQNFFNVPTILSFLLLVLIFFVAVRLYKKNRIMAFGIFLFFITLSLESSIFPIRDVIFEHRLYLPMVGFVVMFPMLFFYFVKNKRVYKLSMSGIILVFCLLTYQRNQVWADRLGFLQNEARKSPKKARILTNLGRAYAEYGQYTDALKIYTKAINIESNVAKTYVNRGSLYARQKKYDLAMVDFDQAIALEGGNDEAYSNKGFVYEQQGLYDLALQYYSKALSFNSSSASIYINRGNIYEKKREYDLAFIDYTRAIYIDPYAASGYNGLGLVCMYKNQYAEAFNNYNHALLIDPSFVVVYVNRGILYGLTGQYDLALQDFDYALKLQPDYAIAKEKKAVLLKMR